MKCPFCSHRDSRVIDSRAVEEGCSIRRRRECPNCGKRFTTYEKYEETPLVVSKKDGRRELFDGKKLLAGLLKACEKRPVPYEKIKEIADSIEQIAQGLATKQAVAVQSDEEEALAGELEQMPDEIDENQRLVQTQLALICRQLGPLRTLAAHLVKTP